jgi:seryl-tRNA synthetase
MLDIKWIRENKEAFNIALERRGISSSLSENLLKLDSDHRSALTELQNLQQMRNQLSDKMGLLKRGKKADDDQEVMVLKNDVHHVKEKLDLLHEKERNLADLLQDQLDSIPNIPAFDVPEGRDETQNVEIRRYLEPKKFSFVPQTHYALGEKLGLMDFERASKISGSRFVFLKGLLSRLERALAQFMLDTHATEFGYTEITPPYLVRREAAYNTGNLPKFEEDLFKTTSDHYLIPTAEMPLTNLVAGEILSGDQLPLRYTAYTPCFRAEAGSAGRDTAGMMRQHQFTKVELVSITKPEDSADEHERMTNAAETILKHLDLPYRVMALCTGDMGFQSQKTYDLEVWVPSENKYREISSCSNCGDFQARRMKTRYRPQGQKNTEFVHTLNGSGLAVGRALIAVLENYQREDGSIVVPTVLRPYMGEIHLIG